MAFSKNYLNIISYYESCLKKHGDNCLGVGWPRVKDAEKRYKAMMDLISFNKKKATNKKTTLLDFGCGASHLFDYILKNKIENIGYSGLDLSKKFVELSKKKFPSNKYYCTDILGKKTRLPKFDYIIMNGVFTVKTTLSFKEMFEYFKKVIKAVFKKARKGIAFNVMSKQVDWERKDLFHLPLNLLENFLVKEVSRNFIIRNDYGLYEYTVYVYKEQKK